MKKLKAAILFGGISEEHDISIKSAIEVAGNINKDKYDVIYVGITRSGRWKRCEKITKNWEEEAGESVILSSNRDVLGMLVVGNGKYHIQPIDVIIPVLHGKMGEDGSIQGLLELSGIPYVGCDIQASAVCLDKSLTYLTVQGSGFKTPEFKVVNDNKNLDNENLNFPAFVKPARSGSSFGITKVECAEELPDAIEEARKYDKKVLIEQAITGIEVGCAVLGNGKNLLVGEVDQIRLTHGFFRIHQEQNPEIGSENSAFIVPAEVPEKKREEIKQTAKAIYQSLGCCGLARIDMFLQADGQIILNEVNTMPGLTSYSRYPRMMRAANIGLEELIDRWITLALERGK